MMDSIVSKFRVDVTKPCYFGGSRDSIIEKSKEQIDQLEAYLENNKFLAGEDLTFVDFILYELIEFLDFLYNKRDFYNKFPKLKAYHDRVHELEHINDYRYYEEHLPFNNTMAKIGFRLENFYGIEDDL